MNAVRKPSLVHLFALAFCLLPAGTLRASPPAEVWSAINRLDFAGAAELLAASADDRTLRLVRAAAVLNSPPRTRAALAGAQKDLADLAGGRDPVATAAAYLVARCEHTHSFAPDPTRALTAYTEVYRRDPGHPLAQQALVKAAIVEFYELDARAPAAIFRHYSALADTLDWPAARRDLHLALGHAALHFELAPQLALTELLAALATGTVSPLTRRDTLVSTALLAHELGQHDLARRQLSLFLDENPRDNRAFLLRRRLGAPER